MTSKKLFVATLDIETKDGLKGSQFCAGSFCYYYYNKLRIITKFDEDEFFSEIFREMRYKKFLVFIQNQDFDIRFIMRFVIEKLKIEPFLIQNNRILQVNVKDEEFDIKFRDTLQFLLCSQAKAEETFLGRKIKVDVDFEKTYELLEKGKKEEKEKAKEIIKKRVENDVIGLLKVMMKYKELFYEKYKTNTFNYVTLPSFALGVSRKYLKEKFGLKYLSINPYVKFEKGSYRWISEETKKLYYWTRESYKGGRTEIFNMNLLEQVYYYDFNSLYPSVCIRYPFPNPKKYFVLDYPDTNYFYRKIKGKFLYIIEAKVKENDSFPILPVKFKNSTRFLNGIKKGVWVSPEFEEFLKNPKNEIIEIVKIRVYLEKEYYFKDFFEQAYNDRLKYKAKGDKAKSQIEKILMNSLTGKFAQKPYREQWVLYNNDVYEKMVYNNQEIEIVEFAKGYKLIKTKEETIRDYMICEFTSFITSYARLELYKLFKEIERKGRKVYYADTDSVFTDMIIEKDKELNQKIGDGILQLKNELIPNSFKLNTQKGKYFNENNEELEPLCFYQAKFYLPKTYVIRKDKETFDIKIKGVSLMMLAETLNINVPINSDIKKLLNKKLNSFEKIERLLYKEGVEMDKFLNYRSALRRNQNIVSHVLQKKSIKNVYDKRKILYNLTTIPATLKDLEDLKKFKTQNLRMLKTNVNTDYVKYIHYKKVS